VEFSGIIELARNYAASYVRSFAAFFSSSGKVQAADGTDQTMDAYSFASISLVIGVILQHKFISRLNVNEIDWLDRAITQISFWIFLAIIGTISLKVIKIESAARIAYRVIFRVLPISFVCGSYSSLIFYYSKFLINMFERDGEVYRDIPIFAFIVVQILICCIFLPREFRLGGMNKKSNILVISIIIIGIVFLIDLRVVYDQFLTGRFA
jgi:hypothetical protein